jgi:hypothetical protein
LGPGPVVPSGLDIDVSYNGMDLFHMGDATANSGTGDLAIAFGTDAIANAATGSNLFDFEPSVFTAAATDAAATAGPADDFGLSSLGLEALAPGLESLINLF